MDRSETKCNVIDISVDEIFKYKDYNNLNGTTLNISRPCDIFMIKYKNNQTWKPTKEFNENSNNTFTDDRDGKIYKTVKIGAKIWMAENLNYATNTGSWCPNCNIYGRFYNWKTANNVCPDGCIYQMILNGIF